MSPVGQALFPALRAGLADFRAQVEGQAGRKVQALGPQRGTVQDLARTVLSAVADALTWLAGALEDVRKVLLSKDALQALLEVASDLLGALSQGVSFGDLPEKLNLDPRPFEAVSSAFATGSSAVATGARMLDVLPSPDDIAAVRQELVLLLGRHADPSIRGEGSLGALLASLQPRT